LAFDLLVGSMIVREARTLCIAAPWRVPALALTFLFGPAGWLWFRAQVQLHRKPEQLSQT
jgi:ABC-type Fe3+ transport system permease subunit